MLRRLATQTVAIAGPTSVAARHINYNWFIAFDASRRPQLTDAERAKVQVNYEEWPEEFRDYDPKNPYKRTPAWIDMSSLSFLLWGAEFGFLYQCWELIYPKSM
jgi:hypothetical protein